MRVFVDERSDKPFDWNLGGTQVCTLPSEDEQKQRALDDAVEFIRGCVGPDYMSAQGLSGQEMQTMTAIQSMWSYCLLYRYKADFTS